MKKYLVLVSLITVCTLSLQSQNHDLGIEFQAYPAGTITGLRYEIGFDNQSVNARVGYNAANRRDWGEHPNEEGGGLGGSLGYRYYFNEIRKDFFLGLRAGIWQLDIDWLDDCNGEINVENCDRNGVSETLVFQPTAEMGWLFVFNEKWIVTPSISYGLEINVQTQGEEVGQGDILLGGLSIGYRF